jgi:hypothetical protein
MRALCIGPLALILLALVVGTGWSQDDGVKAILDKGIKALGGEDKLSRLQALTVKGKGVFHEDGKQIPFAGTWQTQGMDRCRTTTVTTDVKGTKTSETRVVNGDKGWIKVGDDEAKPLSREALAEEKESLYFTYVTSLVPLRSKDFKLAALGESRVEDKKVIGIKVSCNGHRDLKLFLDKESGLLLVAERVIRFDRKERVEEVFFSDYKDVDGIKIAMKYYTKWDGKAQADAELSEAKAQEKLDDSTFTKP